MRISWIMLQRVRKMINELQGLGLLLILLACQRTEYARLRIFHHLVGRMDHPAAWRRSLPGRDRKPPWKVPIPSPITGGRHVVGEREQLFVSAVPRDQVGEPVPARVPACRAFDADHVEAANQVAEDDRAVAGYSHFAFSLFKLKMYATKSSASDREICRLGMFSWFDWKNTRSE